MTWLSFQSIQTVDARRAREPSVPFEPLRAAVALVAPGPLGALLALVPLGAQISWGARVAVQGVRALVVVCRANKKNDAVFLYINS